MSHSKVAYRGAYRINVRAKKHNARGMFQLKVQDANQGAPQDTYAAQNSSVNLDLGSKTFLTAGTKQFSFTITGRHANSSGYTLGFDYITLTSSP